MSSLNRHVPPAVAAAAFALLLASSSAQAATVPFVGIVVNSCTLTVATPGVLTVSPSGTVLGSDQPGGVAATLSVVALGSNPTIAFTAPALTGPTGTSGSTKEIEYASPGGASQTWTTGSSSYSMTRLLDTITVNGEAILATGFPAGTYTLSTVATCSQ